MKFFNLYGIAGMIVALSLAYYLIIYIPQKDSVQIKLLQEQINYQQKSQNKEDKHVIATGSTSTPQQVLNNSTSSTSVATTTDQSKPRQTFIPKSVPKMYSTNITSDEIQPYLNTVVQIECQGGSGSGTLWKKDGQYNVLTNQHVIKSGGYPDGNCRVTTTEIDGTSGLYNTDPSTATTWNNDSDIALIAVSPRASQEELCTKRGECFYKEETNSNGTWSGSRVVSQLNYSVSQMPKCKNRIQVGSPVIVIGYPLSGQSSVPIFGDGTMSTESARITTNGIISGYDESVQKPLGSLPSANYYVTAKIDSGNSGGIAFSKTEKGLCVLGIPTWVSLGNYDSQAVVQNINNILYTGN